MTSPASAHQEQPAARAEPPGFAPSPPAAAAPASQPASGRPDAVAVRRSWDAIKDAVKRRKRTVGAYLMEATVRDVEGETLVLSFKHQFHATAMGNGQSLEIFIEGLTEVMGGKWKVRCEVGDGGPQAARRTSAPSPPPVPPQVPPAPSQRAQPATNPASASTPRAATPAPTATPPQDDEPPWPAEPPPDDPDEAPRGRPSVADDDSTPIGTAAERAERLLTTEFGAEKIGD